MSKKSVQKSRVAKSGNSGSFNVISFAIGSDRPKLDQGQAELIIMENGNYTLSCSCGRNRRGALKDNSVAEGYVSCPRGDVRLPLVVAARGEAVYRFTPIQAGVQ